MCLRAAVGKTTTMNHLLPRKMGDEPREGADGPHKAADEPHQGAGEPHRRCMRCRNAADVAVCGPSWCTSCLNQVSQDAGQVAVAAAATRAASPAPRTACEAVLPDAGAAARTAAGTAAATAAATAVTTAATTAMGQDQLERHLQHCMERVARLVQHRWQLRHDLTASLEAMRWETGILREQVGHCYELAARQVQGSRGDRQRHEGNLARVAEPRRRHSAFCSDASLVQS